MVGGSRSYFVMFVEYSEGIRGTLVIRRRVFIVDTMELKLKITKL